jgi:hypothetical protein
VRHIRDAWSHTPHRELRIRRRLYARLIAVTTLTEMAGRPGVLRGTGPIDPALARVLAHAAARNLKTTWCVTVTDEHGHTPPERLQIEDQVAGRLGAADQDAAFGGLVHGVRGVADRS